MNEVSDDCQLRVDHHLSERIKNMKNPLRRVIDRPPYFSVKSDLDSGLPSLDEGLVSMYRKCLVNVLNSMHTCSSG